MHNKTEEEIIDFLKSRGYTGYVEKPKLTEANWQIFKRGYTNVLCECNDKPPQFHIERFKGSIFNNDYDYLQMKIWGKTNFGTKSWINADFDFTVEEMFDNIDEIEKRCTAMWEAVNKQPEL